MLWLMRTVRVWEIEESKEGEGRMVSVESSAVESSESKEDICF